MSGFLDRLAARAVGEAPLVHPRVRARFEPDAGVVSGGGVEETEQVEEVAAVPRVEVRGPEVEARTFEGVPEGRRVESSPPRPPLPSPSPPIPGRGGATAQDMEETEGRGSGGEFAESEEEGSRLRRDPHPLTPSPTRTHARPGEGEPDRANPSDTVSFQVMAPSRPEEGEKNLPPAPAPVLARVVAPPLPGDVSADGRGGRGVRVHEAVQSEELPQATERHRLASPPSESAEPPPPPPLRPRSALAAGLPTVEPDRRAPLPPSVEASEPSETVVHVSIGRIDVRAAQPPAPERRPARPSGPRLTLADYLKRREEGRR